MSWNDQNNEDEWLSRCVIGILKYFANVESVNLRLSSRGFSFSSTYLGDKLVLWCFDLDLERDGFVKNRFFWDDRFSPMAKWSSKFTPQACMVLIRCEGVPMRFWKEDFFMKLGWLLGEPLMIEEDTVMKRRFDRGNFLLLVPKDLACPDKEKSILYVRGKPKAKVKGGNHAFHKFSISGSEADWNKGLVVNLNRSMLSGVDKGNSCLGLSSPDKGKVVWILKKKIRPYIPSFANAKMKLDKIKESKLTSFDNRLVRSLGGSLLNRSMSVDAEGKAKGLISLWNEDFFFTRKACITGKRYIIFAGELVALKKEAVFCNIYASNEERERKHLWDFLYTTQTAFPMPWCLGGDFNAILNPSER
ncbi:hypothetical protein Ddye_012249 [Dipteronia dyeriana]|uniref:DUF4283 domain-containing protein n=1 Tax=Dipteronia dyeriana TaxID=168575 RepID=A0AAE0CJ32_9ROSI|nr:hypothetical protein Ddye_012249 [Dipteronia dyeriana]